MKSKKEPCKILIVDDHKLFRNGLKMLLENMEGYTVVSEASTGIEFLNLIDILQIDIVLLDISMPEMSGLDAAPIALSKYPDLKIIVLSMYGDEEYYHKMSQVGVKGFLLKDSDIDEVQQALNTVANGGTYFSQDLLMNIVSNLKASNNNENLNIDISEREKEILGLICRGFSNIEIGDKLFISRRTVEKHRANLLEKTGCNNTASLVMWGIKNRMVEV
ncbi:MAG: response regulator transcription factor [Bacteroidales bacterium]|nr:response regulator transcription factor [Bacteroidales bacterium]